MIADIPLGYIHILIDDKSDRFQFKEVIADRASLLQIFIFVTFRRASRSWEVIERVPMACVFDIPCFEFSKCLQFIFFFNFS